MKTEEGEIEVSILQPLQEALEINTKLESEGQQTYVENVQQEAADTEVVVIYALGQDKNHTWVFISMNTYAVKGINWLFRQQLESIIP